MRKFDKAHASHYCRGHSSKICTWLLFYLLPLAGTTCLPKKPQQTNHQPTNHTQNYTNSKQTPNPCQINHSPCPDFSNVIINLVVCSLQILLKFSSQRGAQYYAEIINVMLVFKINSSDTPKNNQYVFSSRQTGRNYSEEQIQAYQQNVMEKETCFFAK